MTQQTASFPRRAFDTIGMELAIAAGAAILLTLWQLPLALLMPITFVWFLTFVSLGFLHQVQEAQPRGARIAVMLLLSSVLLVTILSLVVGVFRNPDAVKKIEDEITIAIKDTTTAEGHSIDCNDCPAYWKNGSRAVLLTSAPILTERRTVPLAPFIVDASTSRNVLVAFWAFAALYFVFGVFICFGSILAEMSMKRQAATQGVGVQRPLSNKGKTNKRKK